MDNQIDKLAREEIKNREIQPRKSVWNQLEAQLDQEQITKNNGKNRHNFWFTGLLLMVILSLVTWFIVRDTDRKTELRTQNLIKPAIESQPSEKNVDQVPEKPISTPLQESKPVISKENNFQLKSKIEIKGIQNKEAKSQVIEKPIEPTAQPIANVIPKDENQLNIETSTPEVVVAQNSTQLRFDASKLLDEANADLTKSTSKYNIDPALLLKSAEKDSRDQFFDKVVRTLAETSTNVYAMVNNRNVEP